MKLPYSFNTGGIQLTNGLQYVIFLSVSEYYTGNIQARMARSGEIYAGGNFVYYNNGGNFDALSTTTWDYLGGGRGDASVEIDFSNNASVVPEPASIVLLASGLGMLGHRLRRKS